MPTKLLEKHLQLLASIPLFGGLTSEQLTKVAAVTQARAYPARAVIVSRGEPADALFAIIRGRLKVVASAPDGRDTVLGIMGDGEVFGEVALLDGGTRSATCTAVEACELLSIGRAPFLALLEQTPSIAIGLLQVMSQRVRRLSQRSEDNAFLDVPSRLSRCLLDLAARFGDRPLSESSGVVITVKLSQQELGALVGATRESVNKHLKDWARQGVLEVAGGRLMIADVQRMRRIGRVLDD